MPHEFTEHGNDPETQSCDGRSGGPPRKHTGVGVLDPSEEISASARPWSIGFSAFLIAAVLAIMALIVFFLNR
jgi:hypothetical protein